MTGLPTVQVLLDDGTGTFPYDITTYVRMRDALTWGRGRGDEQSTVEPGTLSLTLDNLDGRFSYGSATYNVAPDQQIRVKVNGSNHFTGRVQAWPVQWPTGGQEWSTVQITAVDDLARLARRTLYSATQEEIYKDLNPTSSAFWPLDDEPIALSAFTVGRDILGNAPSLIPETLGPATTFGQPLGTPDGANGVQVTGVITLATPIGLRLNGTWYQSLSSLHCEVTYNLASSLAFGDSIDLFQILDASGNPYAYVRLGNGGALTVVRSSSTGAYALTVSTASGPHSVSLDTDGTTSIVCFDGVQIDSRAGTAATYDLSNGVKFGARFIAGGSNTCVIGNAAVGPKLTAAQSIVHQNTALTDDLHETPAARLGRIATYGGATAGFLDTAGSTTLAYANQKGSNALDVLNNTSATDLGLVWVDGSGALTSMSGAALAADSSPDATLDASWVTPDATVQVDMANIVNYAVGVSSYVGLPVVAQDATSIATHGVYRSDRDWNVDTQDQVTSRIQWTVGVYGNPVPRTPTLTLDLMTMDATNLAAALLLDVSKYLRVTGMPSQTPGGTQLDLTVQGITETISDSEWTLTLNCTQKSITGAWILGNATYGVLGSTTRLYVS